MTLARASMALRDWWERIPASLIDRSVGALLFFPGATVLGLSGWLTPSAAGVGTHTQLGLGACMMLSLTGIPCPMCGMTTTFALMAEGRVIEALKNQPFGVVLFLLTLLGTGLGATELVLARGTWRRVMAWVEAREARVAVGILVGMILGWGYKILLLKGILHLHP